MGIKLNLERGFRRITWIISLGLFTVSALVTFFEWQTAKTLWNSAGEPQPKGDSVVYVLHFDQGIQFPEIMTAEHIKVALDTKVVQQLKKDEDVNKQFNEIFAPLLGSQQSMTSQTLTVDEADEAIKRAAENHPQVQGKRTSNTCNISRLQ